MVVFSVEFRDQRERAITLERQLRIWLRPSRPTFVTDIECSNGVIHVIDAVILPKSE